MSKITVESKINKYGIIYGTIDGITGMLLYKMKRSITA